MIQPNLNPAQLSAAPLRARPMSAASLRTPRGARSEDPSFSRLREGQATPRLPPKPEEAPPGEDEPWLFAYPRALTTAEMWRMGFAQAIMFNAAGWTNEATAAAEISGALKAKRPLKGLSAEHRADLESAIAPAFLGGDVIIVVACQALEVLPADDRECCLSCLAKLLDCVSSVWSEYDEMEDETVRPRALCTDTRTRAHARSVLALSASVGPRPHV